jgi:hypothetical protein
MIKRIVLFPFWLIYRMIGIIAKVVQVVIGTGVGTFRFIFKRVLGSIIGAVIGLFLGEGRVGVKLFKRRR